MVYPKSPIHRGVNSDSQDLLLYFVHGLDLRVGLVPDPEREEGLIESVSVSSRPQERYFRHPPLSGETSPQLTLFEGEEEVVLYRLHFGIYSRPQIFFDIILVTVVGDILDVSLVWSYTWTNKRTL